jgi:hypothetical protein
VPGPKGRLPSLPLLLVIFSALCAIVCSASLVRAHSWYPQRCCGGEDCRKVDRIETLEDGDLLFHAGSISVVVPAEFMRLPSPDNDTHVCVYQIGNGEYRPRCVFVPGTT